MTEDQTFMVTKEQLDALINKAVETANASVEKLKKAPPVDTGYEAAVKYIEDHPSFAKYLGKEEKAKAMDMKPIGDD